MSQLIFMTIFIFAILGAVTVLLRNKGKLVFLPAGIFVVLGIVFMIMSKVTQKPWADLGYIIYAMLSLASGIPCMALAVILFIRQKK